MNMMSLFSIHLPVEKSCRDKRILNPKILEKSEN
jgi:hypothetical protein